MTRELIIKHGTNFKSNAIARAYSPVWILCIKEGDDIYPLYFKATYTEIKEIKRFYNDLSINLKFYPKLEKSVFVNPFWHIVLK